MLAGTVPAAALQRPSWVVRLADGGPGRRPGRHRTAHRREGDRAADRRVARARGRRDAPGRLRRHRTAARERRRDVAVLGAIGASRRQVTGTVVAGGVLLAFPAVLAGLPLGAWTFRTLVGITDPADGPDVATLPDWWILLAALPLALAAVAAVSALAAREAARVTVAAALRAE